MRALVPLLGLALLLEGGTALAAAPAKRRPRCPTALVRAKVRATLPKFIPDEYSAVELAAIHAYRDTALKFRAVLDERILGEIESKPRPITAAMRVAAENLARDAERLLKALDIPFRALHTRYGRKLAIKPCVSSALGRLSAGVFRTEKGRVVFLSPFELLEESMVAQWIPATKELALSIDALVYVDPSNGEILSVAHPTESEWHEAWHLGKTRKSERRERVAADGWISPRGDRIAVLGRYSEGGSLDELWANAADEYLAFREVRFLASHLAGDGALAPIVRETLLGVLPRLRRTSRALAGHQEVLASGIAQLTKEALAVLGQDDMLPGLRRERDGRHIARFVDWSGTKGFYVVREHGGIAFDITLEDAWYSLTPADPPSQTLLERMLAMPRPHSSLIAEVIAMAQAQLREVLTVARDQAKAYADLRAGVTRIESLLTHSGADAPIRRELAEVLRALDTLQRTIHAPLRGALR